jgi:hypothetical protein
MRCASTLFGTWISLLLINLRQFRFNDPTFDAVASILRASTILDFPQFRTFAADCMEDAWKNSYSLAENWAHWEGRAVDTAVLARTYIVPMVLKPALYQILKSPTFADDKVWIKIACLIEKLLSTKP